MAYLKFEVDVDTWVTHEAATDDTWDRDSTDGTVTVRSCHLIDDDEYGAVITLFDVAKGDTIWLVWAQYTTGDSFGSDGAQYELCAAFQTAADAYAGKEKIEKGEGYYRPWEGYFESLDSLNVQSFVVH